MLTFFYLMMRRPPRSPRTDTLVPDPTLFRPPDARRARAAGLVGEGRDPGTGGDRGPAGPRPARPRLQGGPQPDRPRPPAPAPPGGDLRPAGGQIGRAPRLNSSH